MSGKRTWHRLLFIVSATVVAASAAAPGPANAQPPAASPAEVAKAKSLFEAGGRAYDRAQYDVALQAFQQAYEIVPKDGLLFSIAQTHRRLYTTTGDPTHKERAIAAYRQYVERAKTGARVSDAVRALEDMGAGAQPAGPTIAPAPSVAPSKTRLYVSSATPGVRISVDNGPFSEPNATVTAEVGPGKHKVRFTAPGFVDKEVEADAVERELVPVSLDLEPKPGSLALVTTSGATISIDGRYVGDAPLSAGLNLPAGRHFVVASLAGYETRSDYVSLERGRTTNLDLNLETTVQRDASFAVFGVAGASLVASGVLLGLTFAKQSEAEDIRTAATERNITETEVDAYEDARSARDTFAIAAGATGAAAGVLAVVGLGMFFIDPPARAEAPRLDEPGSPAGPTRSTDLDDVSLQVGPAGAFASWSLRY